MGFWITETGTYSGDPVERSKSSRRVLAYQSEKPQTIGLLKTYTAGLFYGIEKIFWAWCIVEGFKRDCWIFDYAGLVYDGCDCKDGQYVCQGNVVFDKGKGVKKLSYYTYKKMVEVLEGADWKYIQVIRESDGIRIYQFLKNDNHVWVAWNDNPSSQQVMFTVGDISSVKITEAVPRYESGKDVVDYNTAFHTEKRMVANRQIDIALGEVPLYIEK
jgi:hypothetical protein